ncbi:MAG: RagB/SusD family nutrient uptake outer membrane protein, partial [Tannerella sp.]|nr:RagB/SusD family nutrient uptake outer membrane protein [Tannerella sp.]
FIRAFNYYHMLFYFGDIPLITRTLTVAESRETSRQPRAEVLAFVLRELEESLADIEAVPVTESGRVNRDVINAFLCRVNLYEANYEQALQHADAVINTGKYELFGDYENLFRPQTDGQTKEIIFERQYAAPLYVHEVNKMLSPSSSVYTGWTRVLPLQDFVDEYECIAGHPWHDCEALGCEYVQKRKEVETDTRRGEYEFRDPRLAVSIQYPFWEWKVDGVVKSVYGVDDPASRDYTQSATHTTGYLLAKWIDLRGENIDRDRAEKNMTILRYGDLLLMKAEALIETGQNLGEAARLINQIRARAGMPSIPAGAQDELRRALRHERRIETAFEGLRYFDIIRWRIAGQVKPGKAYGARMKAISENMDHKFMEDRFWDDKMYLFPIPQNARDANPNLTQNPGW